MPFGSVPSATSGSTGICCVSAYEATAAADASRPAAGVCAETSVVAARTAASTPARTKRSRMNVISQSYRSRHIPRRRVPSGGPLGLDRLPVTETRHLFRPVGTALIALLTRLSPEDLVQAGEDQPSPGWFDVGRDFIELWHHRTQVRLALHAEPSRDPRSLQAVLEIAVRGLPDSYRHVAATVVLVVSGPSGGSWTSSTSGAARN